MKINKLTLLFFIIYSSIFIGAMNNKMTFVALGIAFFISILIAFDAIKNNNSKICIHIIILLCLQNFLIGLGAHLAGNKDENLKFLTQIPFMVVFIVWLFMQINSFKINRKITLEEKMFLFLILSIILSIIINRGSLQAILINIRNLTVFYMAYEIGKKFLNSYELFDEFLLRYNKVLTFMLVVGIILLIGGYNLYSAIGIDEVYIAKRDVNIQGLLNQRFYTNLFSHRIMRMGSLYYEPVNLAYLFAIGFIVNLFYKSENTIIKKYRIINIIISGLSLLLTFGKGGWLVAICCIIFVILYKLFKIVFKNFNYRFIYYITVATMAIIIITFCVYSYNNVSTSANPHFWSIIRTWKNIQLNPMGYGLGTGGNMAFSLNENMVADYGEDSSWLSTGGESGIFSFMYQIGIQGVICLVLCMFSMTYKYDESKKMFNNIMKTMPMILLSVAVLQENTFTPQCIVPFMIFQGCCSNLFLKKGDAD